MSALVERILHPEPGEHLGWALAASLGVHLLLLMVMIFWRSWGPSKAELFAPTYQVQLVGMPGPPAVAPKAPPAPKQAPPAPPAPKPELKPKEAIATKAEAKPEKPKPKPPEPSPDAAKELEKRLASLQAKVSDQKRLDSVMSRLEEKAATRSNQVGGAFNSGTTGGGSTGNPSMRDQVYLTELWQRIQAAWVLSEALVQKPKGLVAIVGIRLRADGSLERAWLEQSSGNARYDQSAIRATEKAAPYPPPPGDLRELGIRFRVEDATG